MSRGESLQEMEVKTQQSRTAVNAGAKSADPMPTMADPGTQLGAVEDLGGPTPENYKPDDDSAKLKEPGATLKQVKDVVNKGAGKADPMPKMANPVKEEEEVSSEDEITEEEVTAETEEVVSEEETVEEVVSEEEVTVEYSVEEDVTALLQGEELSEEFQEKAKTIFEAAINSKIAVIEETLREEYTAALNEEVAEIKSTLSERVDSYLEYVAGEWFEENALVVEHGLKTEMTESFLSGMKSLFEDHYVSIPDDKYDVLESMVEKLDEMETKLNEQVEKNVRLNKRLSESVADSILDQVSEGLASTQKEKLASLAEGVEFGSEEEYREKLETLKESYFENPSKSSQKTETLSEGVSNEQETYSKSMSAYLRTLGSTVRN